MFSIQLMNSNSSVSKEKLLGHCNLLVLFYLALREGLIDSSVFIISLVNDTAQGILHDLVIWKNAHHY